METHHILTPPWCPEGPRGQEDGVWPLLAAEWDMSQLPVASGRQLSGFTECGAEPTPLCGESPEDTSSNKCW